MNKPKTARTLPTHSKFGKGALAHAARRAPRGAMEVGQHLMPVSVGLTALGHGSKGRIPQA